MQQELEQQYGIEAACRALDLSEAGQAAALFEWCQAQPFAIQYLVNNAGYGLYGPVAQADPAAYENMLALDIVALTALTTHFAREMVQRRQGRILNIGSLAGFQPVPQPAASRRRQELRHALHRSPARRAARYGRERHGAQPQRDQNGFFSCVSGRT
ncbi:MAG: SDR family NAD(P)-dependent oxidoreductase [Hymenobacter sp.]